MKKNKLLKWAAAVLCLLFSLAISVVYFSMPTIQNRVEQRPTAYFDVDGMEWKDWEEQQRHWVSSTEDAQLILSMEAPLYVSNLRVDGTWSEMGTTVKVYYTSAQGEEFSEANSFFAPLSRKNSDLYVDIDRTVAKLRIDISESTGTVLELEGICVNPTNINVNFLWLLLCFAFPMLLCVLLLELLSDKNALKKELHSVKTYKYLLYDLVARDLKTKYRRSVLGILWSVLNPLLMMLVLTAIFSQIFRFEIDDFPVYYLTGYLIFNFVSEATNLSMTSVINAGGLIKKVYIPKFVFPLEKCLFSLVNMLFSLLAAVIVFVIVGVEPHATMLLFFVPILYTFLFNFGFSMILTAMNTFFRDVGYLYNVFITLWMYLTPIIYPISALPSWLASLIRFNPLYHYVKYFRNVTMYGKLPSLEDNLICIAFSLIFVMLGVLVFRRKQNQFIFYV